MVANAKFMGSSAGSLVSVGLALGLDFDKIKEFQLQCVRRTHGMFFFLCVCAMFVYVCAMIACGPIYVCVCMYVCMYVCICICIYMYMYI